MFITPQIAVQETIQQWLWLRASPGKNKDDYFRTVKKSKVFLSFGCYLCEVWNRSSNSMDSNDPPFCPSWIDGILHFGKSKCPLDDRKHYGCMSDTKSPFVLYETADVEFRDLVNRRTVDPAINRKRRMKKLMRIKRKQAQRIINACQKWQRKNPWK